MNTRGLYDINERKEKEGERERERERKEGTFHVISHLLLHRVTTTDLFQVPIINFIRQMHASAWNEYEHSRYTARTMCFYKKKHYAHSYCSYVRNKTLCKINMNPFFKNHIIFLSRRKRVKCI